jgi:hypothetical protein
MISSLVRPEAEYGIDRDGEDALSFPREQIAVDYIDEQLKKAHQSLRRTRTFCVITVFLILGYMSFITVALRNRLLRPQAAAEMAGYYFSKFAAQDSLPQSTAPPEQSLAATAPVPGSSVTKSIANSVRALTGGTSNGDPLGVEAEVAAYVRGFVLQPHGNLQDLIRDVQHPKTIQQLSDELDQEIRERLPSRVRYGSPDPDYMYYVNQKLATLAELESQFDRLAHADDLTPHEMVIRRILASTMGNIHRGS